MSRTFCRYDRECRDVTDMPWLWSDIDCEILQTRYSDPEQTAGIKTNGPPLFFIQLPDCGDYRRDWVYCETRSLKETLDKWYSEGFEGFWVQA